MEKEPSASRALYDRTRIGFIVYRLSLERVVLIWLVNFPLPPSVNQLYQPFRGRMVKTKHHRQYIDLCILWGRSNQKAVTDISMKLRHMKLEAEMQKVRFCLEVHCMFAFEQSRLFTVNNKNEQLDADNRLKPCLDGLKEVLGIDDKIYFRASSEKVTTYSKESECTIIKIAQMRPRTLAELYQEIMQARSQASSS